MARRHCWLAVLLYGVTLLAYWPSLHGAFLWNDSDYVTARAFRCWHGLWRIWFEIGAVQQYYPVLHTAFWIEHRLWGDSVFGYHLANVLLHATAAFLFALVLQQSTSLAVDSHQENQGRAGPLGPPRSTGGPSLLRQGFGGPGLLRQVFVARRSRRQSAGVSSNSAPPAKALGKADPPSEASAKEGPAIPWECFAAFLFAVHPVCAESVAWISEEKNTLSTVFYLAAALAYLRFHDRFKASSRSPGSGYILASCLFVLALLSKSVAATLPAALLVVIWWRRGRLDWRSDVRPLLPWFAIGAAVGIFTAWVEVRYIGAQGEVFRLSFLQRVLVAGRAIWFYFGKLIWPDPLTFIYPRWKVSASAGWQFLFPIGVFALFAVVWAWRKRSRAPLAALLFFVGSLFPVLGFFNVYAFNFSFVADHFQYLPSLGVIALAAGGGSWLFAGPPRLRALAFIVSLSLGALTWRQCDNYRDEQTFYRAILEKNPASWMARNNLGVWLKRQGRTREAQAEYEEAIRIRPDFGEAQDNLGLILADQSRLTEAIVRFRSAVAAEPRFLEARRNLANALFHSGQTDEAFAQYEEALRLRGNDAHTWNDLGSALFALNRIPEAAERFRTALAFDPYFSEAHSNLGNSLVKMGRTADSIGEYNAALRLDPDNGPARSGLGMALAQSGRLPEAVEEFQAALRFQPDFEQARINLGNVLLAMGRTGEAAAQFEAVLRKNPGSVEAINNLGNVMFRTGRTPEAIARYKEALRIDPVYLESQINLGIALCRLGRVAEGIGYFETALRIDPDSAAAKRDLERAQAILRTRSP